MLPLMRFFIVLFCFNCGDFVTRAAESGPLVIVGGGGTPLAVRQLFVKLAGGKTARIAVLPQASSRKDRGQSSVKMFSELGAKVFIVELKNQKTARAQLDEATAIWFPGGSQAALFDALEKATLVKPIRVRHARGLPIGGTSAGAAVMSAVMIPAMPEKPGLRTGNTPTTLGLGLVPGLIIDQHFIARRRMNRLLSAVLDHPEHIGVGIGEATAIIVRGNHFTVMGKNSVIVIDPRAAKLDKPEKGNLLSATGLRLHVLKAGQEFLFGGKK
jgi:cyanophycinase